MKVIKLILITMYLVLALSKINIVKADSYITEDDIGFENNDREYSKKFSYIKNSQNEDEICRFELAYNEELISNLRLDKRYYIGGTIGRVFSVYREINIYGNLINYFEFNLIRFSRLSNKDVTELLKDLKETDLYKALGKEDKYNISEMIGKNSELDESVLLEDIFGEIKPDLIGGYRLYRPFEGFIGVTLALIAISISALLTGSFVVDIAYMVLPVVEEDGKRPKFVSSVAYRESRELKTGEKGSKQVLAKYFIDRIINVSALVLCLLYLFTGAIFKLVATIMSYFQ